MNAAKLVFRALQTNWSRADNAPLVAEEAASYGEDQDLLALLICPAFTKEAIVAEGSTSYASAGEKNVKIEVPENTREENPDFSTFDKEFSQAAAEIAPWLNSLLKSPTFSQRRT